MSLADPVDWDLARRVATQLAQRNPPAVPWAGVADEVHRAAPGAWVAIAARAGLPPAGPAPVVEVIDREQWIERNLASFRHLVAPALAGFTERAATAERVPQQLAVTQRLSGIELGLLLGWLSSRVLGEHDLLLADVDPRTTYLVGPNIAAVEHHHGLDTGQFRRWITLHGLTHHAQFANVPWLRAHYDRLLGTVISIADPDPVSIFTGLREAARTRSDTRQRLEEGGMVALLASDEQRAALDEVAGVMALLEGHADVTVERAGAETVPDAARFLRSLRERRRQTNPLGRFVHRMHGAEARFALHESGAGFVTAIEETAGPAAVQVCWSAPESLPTLEEIREPGRWLARIHVDPATR